MPAKATISVNSVNLLGKDQAEHTPLGRFITWVTTYGRYIMITTEMIVLLAFLSRFSLDRTLTDLNDEIMQKQEIIEANKDLEMTFRTTQDTLTKIKALRSTQLVLLTTLTTLHTLLPPGTYFQNLTLGEQKVTAQVISLTVQSFSQFLINLTSAKQLSQVEIGTVDKETAAGIQFTVKATIANAQTKK